MSERDILCHRRGSKPAIAPMELILSASPSHALPENGPSTAHLRPHPAPWEVIITLWGQGTRVGRVRAQLCLRRWWVLSTPSG